VALVLSGGGALGLAHVGVIQELERLGIRPDMVVGTSMGAVVGGLYASGVDATTLERVVQDVDWTGVFNPGAARHDLTFRQKAQQADFPVRFSLGFKRGSLLLPAGLISDQTLLQELRRFTPVQGAVADFNDLPIPYRAVATNIETGAAVVLDHGEVPMAMRASMSVPAVFAPVEIEGRLLVDGGMAANIPISVAREMGADIIIVVATQSTLLPQEKIGSALDVLGQTVSLLILANERAQLATLTDRDVLITIDAGGLNAGEFTRGAELVEAGRRSLSTQIDALRAVAAVRAPVTHVQGPPPPRSTIDYVRVENSSHLDDAVLTRKLHGLVGTQADPLVVNAALDDVFALGPFERVDYEIEHRGGQTGLLVRAEDTAPEAGRIRLGLTVSNDFSTNSDYAVSLDYRTGALDGFGSELQLQATLGSRNAASAEYFKLLEPSQTWFVNGRAELENRPVDVYTSSGFKLAGYNLTYGLAALEAGAQFGSVGEVRVGLERGQGNASLNEGVAIPGDIDIDIGRMTASAGIDTLDNPFFPNRGVRLGVRYGQGFTELGDNSDYSTVAATALTALTRGRHTLIGGVSGGTSLDGATPVDALYRLGGLFSLSGYRQDELAGETFTSARLIYRYRLTNTATQLFGAKVYVGASLEAGGVWARREDYDLNHLRYGGSVYVGADTTLGPIYLAYGQSEGGRGSIYLFIGRPF